MKNSWKLLVLCAMTYSCTQNPYVASVSYEELKPMLYQKGNATYVVNFWATWCAPCIEELPYFEALNAQKDVNVLLVSLDFPKHKTTRLLPFLKTHNIQSEVVLLDDANENVWINAIDSTWSGAIPATIFYNQHKRDFYEQSFTQDELNQIVSTF